MFVDLGLVQKDLLVGRGQFDSKKDLGKTLDVRDLLHFSSAISSNSLDEKYLGVKKEREEKPSVAGIDSKLNKAHSL